MISGFRNVQEIKSRDELERKLIFILKINKGSVKDLVKAVNLFLLEKQSAFIFTFFCCE